MIKFEKTIRIAISALFLLSQFQPISLARVEETDSTDSVSHPSVTLEESLGSESTSPSVPSGSIGGNFSPLSSPTVVEPDHIIELNIDETHQINLREAQYSDFLGEKYYDGNGGNYHVKLVDAAGNEQAAPSWVRMRDRRNKLYINIEPGADDAGSYHLRFYIAEHDPVNVELIVIDPNAEDPGDSELETKRNDLLAIVDAEIALMTQEIADLQAQEAAAIITLDAERTLIDSEVEEMRRELKTMVIELDQQQLAWVHADTEILTADYLERMFVYLNDQSNFQFNEQMEEYYEGLQRLALEPIQVEISSTSYYVSELEVHRQNIVDAATMTELLDLEQVRIYRMMPGLYIPEPIDPRVLLEMHIETGEVLTQRVAEELSEPVTAQVIIDDLIRYIVKNPTGFMPLHHSDDPFRYALDQATNGDLMLNAADSGFFVNNPAGSPTYAQGTGKLLADAIRAATEYIPEIDINRDGIIDDADANLLISLLVGNEPPVIDPISNISIVPNRQTFPVTSEQIQFPVTATDPEGDEIEITMVISPMPTGPIAEGMPPLPVFDSYTNMFKWQPSARDAGEYTVTFTATDTFGGTSHTTVEINVEEIDVCNGGSAECANLRVWHQEGSAAGPNASYEVDGQVYDGIVYGNRDRAHSWRQPIYLNNLRIMEGWATAYDPYEGVVFAATNSSTSGPGPLANNSSIYQLSQQGADTLENLARNNLIHSSPEHKTHDRGQMYEDATIANQASGSWVSQGSSGSERKVPGYFMGAAAAMNADVQRSLASNGMMARTLQMLLRQNYKADGANAADYFSDSAHPSVFVADNVDGNQMIEDAHNLQYGYLPPEIGIDVLSHNLDDDLARDILPNGQLSTEIFETSTSASYVKRGVGFYSEFIVRPSINTYEGSLDNAEIRVETTRGEGVITEDLGDGTYKIKIPYQGMQAVETTGILSARVDVAFFAVGTDESGAEITSAPSFLSLNHPRNAVVSFNASDQPESISYVNPRTFWQHNQIDGLKVGAKRIDFNYVEGEASGVTVVTGSTSTDINLEGFVSLATDELGRMVTGRKSIFKANTNNILHLESEDQIVHFEYVGDDRRITMVEQLQDEVVTQRILYSYDGAGNLDHMNVEDVDAAGVGTFIGMLTPTQEPDIVRASVPGSDSSALVRYENNRISMTSTIDFFAYLSEINMIIDKIAEDNDFNAEELILYHFFDSGTPPEEPSIFYTGNLGAAFSHISNGGNYNGYAWIPRSFEPELFPEYPSTTGFSISIYDGNLFPTFYDYDTAGNFMGTHRILHAERVKAVGFAKNRFAEDFPGLDDSNYTVDLYGFETEADRGGTIHDHGLYSFVVRFFDASSEEITSYEVQKRSTVCDTGATGVICSEILAGTTYHFWRLIDEDNEDISDFSSEGIFQARRTIIRDDSGNITDIESRDAAGVLISTVTLQSLLGGYYSEPGTAEMQITGTTFLFTSVSDLIDQIVGLE